MATDVTMKDLQSLQGYVNKQLGEVRNKIDENWKSVTKSEMEDVMKLEKRLDSLEKKFDNAIEQINAGFKDLTGRINALSRTP
ncbi:MAG: hypothetical protein JNN18_07605 [Rubrivivax sp.]|jgi:predicted  nucleic acid-binding Zn-ribbon protein|nr:hypothetical protein [Rubrivivax sp.]